MLKKLLLKLLQRDIERIKLEASIKAVDDINKEMGKLNTILNENYMYVSKEVKFLNECIYGGFLAKGDAENWVGIHSSLLIKE